MDFDDVQYTEWQIDRVRVALNKYRIAAATGGRLPSWARVRDDIIYCLANIERYSEDDAELRFKDEALRRFANAESTPDLDKLRDVTRFLIEAGLLTLAELDEEAGDLREFLALHAYLANSSEASRAYTSMFNGIFLATRKTGRTTKRLLLRLMPDRSQTFLRVEEITEHIDTDDSPKTWRDSPFEPARARRKGYGCAVTSLNVLHIFLDGFLPEERITYVQAGELYLSRASTGVYLMRNGEHTGRDALPQEMYESGKFTPFNIHLFRPAPNEAL